MKNVHVSMFIIACLTGCSKMENSDNTALTARATTLSTPAGVTWVRVYHTSE